MCLAGEIGRLWSKDILNGRKSPQEAMINFKMDLKGVMNHVNNHDLVIDEELGKYESPDFFMNELLKMFKMCKDWLNYCVNSEKINKADLDTAIRLIKEMRENLKLLAELRGKTGGNSTDITVNVDVINQKYLYITNRIITEVCPECQLKIVNLMDQIEPIKITSTT